MFTQNHCAEADVEAVGHGTVQEYLHWNLHPRLLDIAVCDGQVSRSIFEKKETFELAMMEDIGMSVNEFYC